MIEKQRLLYDLEYLINHTLENSPEHYAYKQCRELVERQPEVKTECGDCPRRKWYQKGYEDGYRKGTKNPAPRENY